MAKGLKTLAALGGLGAAAYLAGKMGKKDEDVDTTADASAGMAKTRLGKDESNYDELANMDRTKAARQAKASKAAGKSMMKKAAPTSKADASTYDRDTVDEKTPATNTGGASRYITTGTIKPPSFRNRFETGAAAASESGNDGSGTGKFSEGELNSRMTRERLDMRARNPYGVKKGGEIKAKKYAGGGSVGSASRRADGCAMRGKTKGRMV